MPWWSIVYLVLFLAVVFAGTWFEVRDGEDSRLVDVLDVVSVIICAYLFVSFWVSSWRQPLGATAPWLFVFAAGWQIYDTRRGMRSFLADPDLSELEKRWVFVGVTAFLLPAFTVAGVAAFK
jgi:hypothetical protein